jgi:hypothetical protein
MKHLSRLHKQLTRLERLARGKHSSLFQKFVTYSRKKFYDIGPGVENFTESNTLAYYDEE